MTVSTLIRSIDAVQVAAGEEPWAITDENGSAVLRHDFPSRVDRNGVTYNRRVEYLVPRRLQPVDFADNEAVVNVDPAATLRWSTYEDHVKGEVIFTRKPDAGELWFAVNVIGLSVVEDLDQLALFDPLTGEYVARLPRPFLRDNQGVFHDLAWVFADGALTVTLPDLDPELWVGAVFDPTTIDTSTSAAPSAYPNQKKIVRLGNAQLVIAFNNGTPEAEFWYSTDNGATWTQFASGTSNLTGWVNGSIAFYTDTGGTERLAVTWKQSGAGGGRTDGYIYAAVGSFNAGRTTLTWGTAIATPLGTTELFYPDIVCCPESTGGRVHVFAAYQSAGASHTDWWKLSIDNVGVLSSTSRGAVGGTFGAIYTYPSADINTSTKDLYVAYQAGTTGAGTGIRFMKFTYSAGTWTSGTEREIDNGRYVPNNDSFGLICRFDGTRVVMGGMFFDATTAFDIVVWERDAADTTTTTRVVVDNAAATAFVASPSLAVNTTTGDIYLLGRRDGPGGGTDRRFTYYKFTRASVTWSAVTDIENIGSASTPYAAARGDGTRLDVLYTTATGSPYNVRFYNLPLNTAPTAATWVTVTGAFDVAASLTLAWTFNDPDAGDSQSAYALKRDIGGATTHWWNGSDWTSTVEVYVTSGTSSVTLSSGWGSDSDADYHFYVSTKDAAGVAATAYSSVLTVTPSAKVNPTVTAPSAGGTVGASSYDAQWTVSQQSAYRVKLYDSAGTTTLWDSGWITDPTTTVRRRTIAYSLVNSTSYKLGVTTQNTEGLTSTEAINSFTVSYTAPATPTNVNTANSTTGQISVAITNPTPGGGQPAIASNNVWRRHVGLTDAIRIATGVANNGTFVDLYPGHREAFQYQVEAIGTNGISAFGAWTT